MENSITTCTGHSSHGCIVMNAKTGDVIKEKAEYYDEKDPDCYIKNIKKFDIPEWEKYWGKPFDQTDIDILDLSYWNDNGTYDTAEESWREDVKKWREENAEAITDHF